MVQHNQLISNSSIANIVTCMLLKFWLSDLSQSTFESITLAVADLFPLDTLSSELSLDSQIVSSALHAENNDGYNHLFNDVYEPHVSSNSNS